ncbi:chemotaxis response regulator protein-glutamate methylesterase [Reichenbachiella agarivorans]|uniref:Protein-glutamate methylesterase/protein-glutamine glutaminase n=1 Tax=Reichenbachiella agarivorans TaxID=2979464 RepID=A0ABY6CNI5_9BACT|nr:chemotaxis response regulator protein-glutamate methylesterase [Reichenbachiella agarivorans]UXP32071.1 chemotaxis response regulator protein-glutamate methylesterase [Reichenbachiella agarivorans]
MNKEKIKILIIDDSRAVQRMLEFIIAQSEDLEVIGAASDAYEAVEIMREVKPNVIILDVRMPRMDGLTFLKKLMSQHPIPVIVFSSLITKNPEIGVKALEYGAVDVIDKPIIDYKNMTTTLMQEARLLKVIRTVGRSKLSTKNTSFERNAVSRMAISSVATSSTDVVICIGASAGGTQAVKHLLARLPDNLPPILIVQHMPVEFTGQYARYLNDVCSMTVTEAIDGEKLQSGHAYVAPGDQHLTAEKHGAGYRVKLLGGEKVSGHKPSVDVLFRSAANVIKSRAIGVILTGMGKDGAAGLLEMKGANSYTIAQDESSCVVFGMPMEAIKLGAVDQVCSLDDIPQAMISLLNKMKNINHQPTT